MGERLIINFDHVTRKDICRRQMQLLVSFQLYHISKKQKKIMIETFHLL